MSTFRQIQTTFRAFLISSLLVLGHTLLTTAAINAGTQLDHSIQVALRSTSALIFITLLWTSFNLIEQEGRFVTPPSRSYSALDRESEDEDEVTEGLIFGRTWVEGLLSSLIFGSWILSASDTLHLIRVYSPDFWHVPTALIPISYGLTLLSLFALHTHFFLSLSRYVLSQGFRAVCSIRFWNQPSGHWTIRIVLDDIEAEDGVPVDPIAGLTGSREKRDEMV